MDAGRLSQDKEPDNTMCVTQHESYDTVVCWLSGAAFQIDGTWIVTRQNLNVIAMRGREWWDVQ